MTILANPLSIGMVGGGAGAFIGAVHRLAMRMDGTCRLVCGALSSTPERSIASGAEIGLSADRAYGSWEEMINREAQLPPAERMEAVAIVTPNHLHLPVAMAALKAGFHVISDKPATLNLPEAQSLFQTVRGSDRLYAITHTYLGYPMVREARRLVSEGYLGRVRKIYVEYIQGWLAQTIEDENKQAAWRSDPARSGLAGCMGDIGSHAHNLAEFIAGTPMTSVRAWLQSVAASRALDDDGAVFFQMDGGATGVLTASQVCAGEENALRIRVYGDRAGLDWHQEEPNTLIIKHGDGRQERRRSGSNMPLGADEAVMCRTPSGHPEGYLEAFATLYRDFAMAIRSGGQLPSAGQQGFVPGISEAFRGMAFIDAVVSSSSEDGCWKRIPYAE